jgi:NAD(P)-dependent dehydrogenase (short-subunit alcohol dehydrogenase family)
LKFLTVIQLPLKGFCTLENYQIQEQFNGKSVLVTGGGSGIGRATAIAFAKQGARVAVVGRRIDRLEETIQITKEIGGQCIAIQADLTQGDQVESMVQRVIKEFGSLNYAFNNAGILGTMGNVTELTEQNFDEVMSINVKGVWLCMKYEIAQMLEQKSGGAIVNNASLSGVLATPGGSAYNASKHAVIGLTKCAAVEYARSGIRVNAVCPGSFPTDMLEQFLSAGTTNETERQARQNLFLSGIPMGRFGNPSEVGDVVLWLCSQASSFVTGQAIIVDGGAVIM